MKQRVFIVHGWSGNPEEAWFPWLRQELEAQKYAVSIPPMPEPEYPEIGNWTAFLAKQVRKPDRHTFFVGHSIGCQAILRTVERMGQPVGGAVFVAGFLALTPKATETPDDREIAKPWLETPIDFPAVRALLGPSALILSDNDPYVPLENGPLFAEKLGSKVLVVRGKGHIGGEDGIREFGPALSALLDLAR